MRADGEECSPPPGHDYSWDVYRPYKHTNEMGEGAMFTFEVNGVNDAYDKLARVVYRLGREEETRNGPARALPGPLLMRCNYPNRRVLFNERRDANPTFHLMESLWMLAGRNDTAFVQQFNSNIASYSDDGTTFNASYGFRWANHFGYDQLDKAVEMLTANPDDRRVVISMWDGHQDLGSPSKDIPCNTQIMLRTHRSIGKNIHTGQFDYTLDMTTVNRSNDVVWGLCGANFVHLTILQEWLARACGFHLGKWHHMSNNVHMYERHYKLGEALSGNPNPYLAQDPYEQYATVAKGGATLFRKECNDLVDGKEDFFEDPFFDGTVAPALSAWQAYKAGDKARALYDASCIDAWDWRNAIIQWYRRRK